jgi:hypothetical protein
MFVQPPGPYCTRRSQASAGSDRLTLQRGSPIPPFKDSSSGCGPGCPLPDEEYREDSRRYAGAILASSAAEERQAAGWLDDAARSGLNYPQIGVARRQVGLSHATMTRASARAMGCFERSSD